MHDGMRTELMGEGQGMMEYAPGFPHPNRLLRSGKTLTPNPLPAGEGEEADATNKENYSVQSA